MAPQWEPQAIVHRWQEEFLMERMVLCILNLLTVHFLMLVSNLIMKLFILCFSILPMLILLWNVIWYKSITGLLKIINTPRKIRLSYYPSWMPIECAYLWLLWIALLHQLLIPLLPMIMKREACRVHRNDAPHFPPFSCNLAIFLKGMFL